MYRIPNTGVGGVGISAWPIRQFVKHCFSVFWFWKRPTFRIKQLLERGAVCWNLLLHPREPDKLMSSGPFLKKTMPLFTPCFYSMCLRTSYLGGEQLPWWPWEQRFKCFWVEYAPLIGGGCSCSPSTSLELQTQKRHSPLPVGAKTTGLYFEGTMQWGNTSTVLYICFISWALLFHLLCVYIYKTYSFVTSLCFKNLSRQIFLTYVF